MGILLNAVLKRLMAEDRFLTVLPVGKVNEMIDDIVDQSVPPRPSLGDRAFGDRHQYRIERSGDQMTTRIVLGTVKAKTGAPSRGTSDRFTIEINLATRPESRLTEWSVVTLSAQTENVNIMDRRQHDDLRRELGLELARRDPKARLLVQRELGWKK